jgi:flagellar basal-body rod protein FlgB
MNFETTGLDLGRFLSYLSARQEVISANIANADTPGYKTKDVETEFSAAFAEARDAAFSEVPGLTAKNDGNNVNIDREARLLSETTIRFNLAAQIIRTDIKNIRAAIEEGRSS